ETVREIDKEVDEHIEAGHHQEHALHQVVVALLHGAHHQPAYARIGEHGLDYHGAAEQGAQGHADHGHHWDERVAQYVFEVDRSLREALRPGRAREILAHVLEHARACDTGSERRVKRT